jgi:exodeoxyribonuclease VII large subunit
MFRRAAGLLDFDPGDGMRVEIRGRLAVYEPRGELQFVAEAMRLAGAGSLYEQFLRLRERLEAAGLFARERKRPLPSFPTRIGIVTSLGAAALHDVLTALARRAPQVAVVVYPSLVQGSEAPRALVAALEQANARQEVDLLLLVRGGGSLEDLWAFNDERVVRAVAGSALPVVCGVGHETDITLADLAADLRAPTPTAAAELAAPARADCLDRLHTLGRLLQLRTTARLDGHAQRLDRLALKLARPSELVSRQGRLLALLAQRTRAAPIRRVELEAQKLTRLAERREQALARWLQRQQARLDTVAARLSMLDPQHVLARGYAWLQDEAGHPITSVAALRVGQAIEAKLADGAAELEVRKTR